MLGFFNINKKMKSKKYTIIFCLMLFLAGMIIGSAIKKTSDPVFNLGNEEIDLKMSNY